VPQGVGVQVPPPAPLFKNMTPTDNYMKIEKVSTEGLQNVFRVTFTENFIDKEKDKILTHHAKAYKKPGFRPGKVPMTLLKKEFGAAALQQALDDNLNAASKKIVKENKLTPISTPQVKVVENKDEKSKDFQVDLVFESMPEIKLGDFSKIVLEKFVAEPEQKDIDKNFEHLLDRHAPYAEVKRAIKKDDIVTLKLSLMHDGKPVKEVTDRTMYLRANNEESYYVATAKALVGKKVGDSGEVEETLSDKFAIVDLQGKKVTCLFKIEKVEEKGQFTPDDKFYEGMGVKTKEELLEKIKETLQNEMNRDTRLHMKRNLFDQLSASYEFDLPPSILDAEKKNIQQQMKEEDEAETEDSNEIEKLAVRRVRLGLLIGHIAKENKLSPSEHDLLEKIKPYIFQMQGSPEDNYKKLVKNERFMEVIRSEALEEIVVDFLLSKITVKEKNVSVVDLQKKMEAILPEA
jgi:trigger factor